MQQAPGGRSATLAASALRLESEMRDQRPARKLKAEPARAVAICEVRNRLRLVDEDDIAGVQLHELAIVVHRRSAGYEEQDAVSIHAVASNIARLPVDAGRS